MKFIPPTKLRMVLLFPMMLIVWCVCPDIKVMFGRLWRRHFYETGEPVGMRE